MKNVSYLGSLINYGEGGGGGGGQIIMMLSEKRIVPWDPNNLLRRGDK